MLIRVVTIVEVRVILGNSLPYMQIFSHYGKLFEISIWSGVGVITLRAITSAG